MQYLHFSIVGQDPQRMRALPRREGVGTEASVHQRQIGVEFRIEQVCVIMPELIGVKQSLVDDRERRQRADVEAPARFCAFVS